MRKIILYKLPLPDDDWAFANDIARYVRNKCLHIADIIGKLRRKTILRMPYTLIGTH